MQLLLLILWLLLFASISRDISLYYYFHTIIFNKNWEQLENKLDNGWIQGLKLNKSLNNYKNKLIKEWEEQSKD